MMSTWLSFGDLTQLLERALHTPNVGHTVVYGMSDNKEIWWDNRYATALGFAPQDSSEVFREKSKPSRCPPPMTRRGSIRAAPSAQPGLSVTEPSRVACPRQKPRE